MPTDTSAESGLTAKQREVLELVRAGKNPTEIGRELGITSQAIHGHFRRLRERGLMPGGPKPTAARKTRDDSAPVSPEAAIMAAMEGIRAQQHQLNERLTAIADEREALDEEERAINEALDRLRGMAGDTPEAA